MAINVRHEHISDAMNLAAIAGYGEGLEKVDVAKRGMARDYLDHMRAVEAIRHNAVGEQQAALSQQGLQRYRQASIRKSEAEAAAT
ncbi:MAG: hypothetical protein IMZ50_03300, partial [Candidatus Atribacteria bacterium]|nr:hypothetical protein [Candidatus Atribacteria bacterium]